VTKVDAIHVLEEFRKALMALDPLKGRQAFDALINDARVVTTAMRRAAEAGAALQTLRRAFEEIDGKGIRFPSD
jgi:glycerol-3-phosphate dehydrogenase